METSPIFTEGLSFFLPRESAPNYVIGSLTIDPRRFVEWMNANKQHLATGRDRDGRSVKLFRIDLKMSQGGRGYAALNTWKPQPEQSEAPAPAPRRQPAPGRTYRSSMEDSIDYPIEDGDIPF